MFAPESPRLGLQRLDGQLHIGANAALPDQPEDCWEVRVASER